MNKIHEVLILELTQPVQSCVVDKINEFQKPRIEITFWVSLLIQSFKFFCKL